MNNTQPIITIVTVLKMIIISKILTAMKKENHDNNINNDNSNFSSLLTQLLLPLYQQQQLWWKQSAVNTMNDINTNCKVQASNRGDFNVSASSDPSWLNGDLPLLLKL